MFRLHGKQTDLSSFFVQRSCRYCLKYTEKSSLSTMYTQGKRPAPSAKPLSVFLEGSEAVMFPGSLCLLGGATLVFQEGCDPQWRCQLCGPRLTACWCASAGIQWRILPLQAKACDGQGCCPPLDLHEDPSLFSRAEVLNLSGVTMWRIQCKL